MNLLFGLRVVLVAKCIYSGSIVSEWMEKWKIQKFKVLSLTGGSDISNSNQDFDVIFCAFLPLYSALIFFIWFLRFITLLVVETQVSRNTSSHTRIRERSKNKPNDIIGREAHTARLIISFSFSQ